MTSPRKGKRSTADRPGRKARCGWMVFLLVLLAGCVHVPVSSDIVVADRLEAATPLEPGDVLLRQHLAAVMRSAGRTALIQRGWSFQPASVM